MCLKMERKSRIVMVSAVHVCRIRVCNIVHTICVSVAVFTDEEEVELDKEMGKLGSDNPEDIDRNMWAAEEEQEDTKVGG